MMTWIVVAEIITGPKAIHLPKLLSDGGSLGGGMDRPRRSREANEWLTIIGPFSIPYP